MKKKATIALLALVAASGAHADCVIGAKSKTNVQILGAHTMLLTGGYNYPIILKSFAFLHSNSRVAVLKDSFCSFDGNAIAVDGQQIPLQEVQSAD